MLSECKGRNKYQSCDNLRQILVPFWNIFTFSKSYTAKPARHTVNGRKQIYRLVNLVQKTNCTSKDVSSGLVFVVGKNTKQTKQISRA